MQKLSSFVAPPRDVSRRVLLVLAFLTIRGAHVLSAQDSSVVIAPDSMVVPRDAGPFPWSAPADSTGADITVIFPDSLPDMPRTMSELLAGRVPGMFVQRSSGAAGASSWISIRDAGAVQAAEPLVVVDGVRRVTAPISYNIFEGTRIQLPGERLPPSPIDDIPVDQVERIEILRGPAAAARYGRDARYGVIVVTSRPPALGRPRFRASLTGGLTDLGAKFPANYAQLTATGGSCPNASAVAGFCTPVSTGTYTVLRDRSPFQRGARRGARFDATAGLGPVAIALGASHERADGVLPMDGADQTAVTARLLIPLGERVRLSMSAQTSLRGVTQPAQGSSELEVISGGVYGDPIDCSPTTPCQTSTTSHGYAQGTPEYLAKLGPRRRVQHYSESAVLDVGVTPWLSSQSSISYDGLADRGKRVDVPMPGDPFQFLSTGDVVSHSVRSWLGESVRAKWVLAGFQATTTLDASVDRNRSHESFADFSYALFDGTVLSNGAWGFSNHVDRRTTIRVEQRADAGARAGVGVGAAWTHTKTMATSLKARPTLDGFADAFANLIDPASELRGIRSLRVRAAIGQVSGYDESTLGRFIFLAPPVYGFPPVDSKVPSLRAQRAVELEGGIDAELTPAHLRLSLTAYARTDTDPYVPFQVAQPSASYYGAIDMRRRLTGVEVSAGATVLDVPRARWLTHAHFAVTRDRVTKWQLGPRVVGGDYGAFVLIENGKPFGNWLAQPNTWSDANGDGIIARDEVTNSGFGPALSSSPSRPTQSAGLQNSITLLGALTVGAQVDYIGGHKVLNAAAVAQCRGGTCAAINDPRAPLADQAKGVAAYSGGSLAGYLESGATIRLRELSVSLGSARMASIVHAGSLSITVAGRNLATWSRYHGLDPETDLLAPGMDITGQSSSSTLYLPNTRQLTARLTLAY